MTDQSEKLIHSSFWSNIFKKNVVRSELTAVLRSMPPFAQVSEKLISELDGIMHHRQFIAGEYIFLQNDPGIGLYVINDGQVAIEKTENGKDSITLAEFSIGDFFGELALLDGETRSASAKAITDCKVSVLFKPDLDRLLDKYPKEGLKVVSGIAEIVVTRLRKLNDEYFTLYQSVNKGENNESRS
jgi:CRP-like cAMP-binding protein